VTTGSFIDDIFLTSFQIAEIVRKNFPALAPPQGEQTVAAYNIDISPLNLLGISSLITPEKMVVDAVFKP
jgi:hypothetical protein